MRLASLSREEKELRKRKSSQFKLRYKHSEYHYKFDNLHHSKPKSCPVSLDKIQTSLDVLGLILTFHITCSLAARKTAWIMKNVFEVKLSYQTVLNYCASAAFYLHDFNMKYKGSPDPINVGDETYIKIMGKNNYVFFFVAPTERKIISYHVADNRSTLPAIIAMKEAIKNHDFDNDIKIVTDGNPSYLAGIHYLNEFFKNLKHSKVIGLQNLDVESEEYRPYKQIIERLNRTYKSTIRSACGFKDYNGAVSLTTCFVTNYNFLRPHTSLNYNVPIPLDYLDKTKTIQGKWTAILKEAIDLQKAA